MVLKPHFVQKEHKTHVSRCPLERIPAWLGHDHTVFFFTGVERDTVEEHIPGNLCLKFNSKWPYAFTQVALQ
jgi:hypothetical protein